MLYITLKVQAAQNVSIQNDLKNIYKYHFDTSDQRKPQE